MFSLISLLKFLPKKRERKKKKKRKEKKRKKRERKRERPRERERESREKEREEERARERDRGRERESETDRARGGRGLPRTLSSKLSKQSERTRHLLRLRATQTSLSSARASSEVSTALRSTERPIPTGDRALLNQGEKN